ncbi:MAG: HD domain-containing phosphohydrolase [Pirellulales bacterium]
MTVSLNLLGESPQNEGFASVPTQRAKLVPLEAVKEACIVIVDDESLNIDVVQGYLEMEGYQHVVSTSDATAALPLIAELHPDLVLLDIHMPQVDGLQILKVMRSDPALSHIPVVILTATSDRAMKLQALQAGAIDLLSKPVHQGELLARIRNVLTVKAYQDRLQRYSEELETAVRKRTAELEGSRLEVIHCLARAAEFRDDDTGQHILRVGRYARIIGAQLGLSPELLDILEPAAQLHDVGKIGIPDAILLKPGKLTPEEYEVIQKHCGFGKKIAECLPSGEAQLVRAHAELGARIMDIGASPILSMAKRIALTHHERWDGTGYPLGLAGDDIPLEGRITAVADVFDALSSKRVYKPAFPLKQCFDILRESRQTHFDPAVVDAFFARKDHIVAVQIELANTE